MAGNQKKTNIQEGCFVIMPIADPDGYEKGHFSRVYEDIFKPACENAGFSPIRADEVKQTNLIHLDILQKLIESPMAICDLSSRNPNVLFELGLRQAFDKPTVLVQEIGTPKIFDISPLRYTEYRRELGYRDVLEDQQQIAMAIEATAKASKDGTGVNSIVKILALSHPAKLPESSASDSTDLLQIVRAEMSDLRSEFRHAVHQFVRKSSGENSAPIKQNHLRNYDFEFDRLKSNLKNGMPADLALREVNNIQRKILNHMNSETSADMHMRGMKIFEECVLLEQELSKLLADQPQN
jgi:hypothetical protein